MNVTESVENYLETIHILSLTHPQVHAIDICNYLEFSRPTVSIVLKQLKDGGFVNVDENNHIWLTDRGLAIATHIYERHQLLTRLFISIGVEPELAQHDACKIEHDLSDETFAAIKHHFETEHLNGMASAK